MVEYKSQIQTIKFTNELQKTTKVGHKLQSLLIDYKTTKVGHRLQSLLIDYRRLQMLDIVYKRLHKVRHKLQSLPVSAFLDYKHL